MIKTELADSKSKVFYMKSFLVGVIKKEKDENLKVGILVMYIYMLFNNLSFLFWIDLYFD